MNAFAPPSAARIDDSYPDWVRAYDTLDHAARAAIAAEAARLLSRPLISLLLPLSQQAAGSLAATLATLARQLYPRWELCVAGRSDDAAALAAAAARERRIRLVDPTPFADTADALNAGLAAANGTFVALLSPGDHLADHALYEIATELARHPDAALLYTDEDRIDAQGQRSAPRFKTGWDPDLLLAYDYIGGLAVWRRDAIAAAGGWRAGLGGAASHDLALRVTATLPPDRIHHLPIVALHRAGAEDPPLREGLFGADAEAARRVVREHLGPEARIEPAPLWPTANRVIWAVPAPAPLVSVIIPTRDRASLLAACAWGVLTRTDYSNIELLIVDNDSAEPSTADVLRDLAREPRVRVLRHPGAFNFSAINNHAASVARGEVLLLLNNDVEVIEPGWLTEMVGQVMRPDVGAVGAKLLYPDGRLQHGGIVLGPGLAATHILRCVARTDPGYAGQLAVARTLLCVTGACLAIRRAVYEEVGGLAAGPLAAAFNDLDLCLRLGEHGYRVVWTPFAELFHHESQSRGTPDTPQKAAQEEQEVDYLWRYWRHCFDSDPFHNPNLTCSWHEPFHLCPPRRQRAA
jgi:GT2 family glycosyltransferase